MWLELRKKLETEQAFHHYFSEMAIDLLASWDLESVLKFMFAHIRLFRPVQQIHCIIRNMEDASKVVLGEVGPGQKAVTPGTADVYTRMGGPADSYGPYLVNDMEHDPLFGVFYDTVQYRSMLRVPLFTKGQYVCFLGIWSDTANAFQQDDLRTLQEHLQPFGAHLESLFVEGTLGVPDKAQHSVIRLVQICRGLNEQYARMVSVAKTRSTILITGETGSGKGVVARAVHELSDRARRPFVAVNCGSIPETLVESQLFGHERGSFTGAVSTQKGLFEQANGGTIFLDEIAELSLFSQARLLHVLDNHRVTRIGGQQGIPLDIRVIAATNKDLAAMVARGEFREDLFYRLRVYPIRMPSLRERREDIITLAHHFLMAKSKEMGMEAIIMPSRAELARLHDYDWPGNVRELEYVVERALLDARRETPMPSLHFELEGEGRPIAPAWEPQPKSLDEAVQEHLIAALRATEGRIYGEHGAAALLRVHPLTIRNKMRKYGLDARAFARNSAL